MSSDFSFRRALPADASALAALANAAYGHYVSRIGMLPGPMTYDYANVIAAQEVTVAELDGQIAGLLVLDVSHEGFLIDNVAVEPIHRGKGLGRALLAFAEGEARRSGFESIHLFTHEKMTENIALYAALGYVEYDRRCRGEFSLVFMRKQLR